MPAEQQHQDQVVQQLDKENQLLGIVHFNDIREIIFSNFKVKYTRVQEIMCQSKEIIYPTDTMETVMNKFEISKVAFLPVLKNSKYHGFISKSIALEAYRMKLKSMTVE